jgi:histidinol phosphatase-like PHP family hydrolase
MTANASPTRVSVHGGHSGEFCTHAVDSLEEVVQAYVQGGFSWVGITEHMPPAADRWVFDDEREAGLPVPENQPVCSVGVLKSCPQPEQNESARPTEREQPGQNWPIFDPQCGQYATSESIE